MKALEKKFGAPPISSSDVAGDSGRMTWHAKALTTSYLTPPDAGAKGHEESEAAFPFSTINCSPSPSVPA